MTDSRLKGRTGDALLKLYSKLAAYRVTEWATGGSADNQQGKMEQARIEDADVISSQHRDDPTRHALVIDIDLPTYLARSTTPDHYHLYVDVPGGIGDREYFNLLDALAEAGVIEYGYARVSRKRGHSDVRLPWIKKGQSDGQG